MDKHILQDASSLDKAVLLGIRNSVQNPLKGNGYNVLNLLSRDGVQCIALQPFEKWTDPKLIKSYFGSEVVLTKNIFGQLQVHENTQKEIYEELGSFKNDLKNLTEVDEILAMGIEQSNKGIEENAEKIQELKNYILEVLTRVEAIEKAIKHTDQDLFNLMQVLIYPGNNHAIPLD